MQEWRVVYIVLHRKFQLVAETEVLILGEFQ